MTIFARLRCDVCKRFKRADSHWFHLEERYDSSREATGFGVTGFFDICSPTCLTRWIEAQQELRKGYGPGHRWDDWGKSGNWGEQVE